MKILYLLEETLPYLKTLLNLHVSRTEPCMSQEDEKILHQLIDEIWELTKKYERAAKAGSDFQRVHKGSSQTD